MELEMGDGKVVKDPNDAIIDNALSVIAKWDDDRFVILTGPGGFVQSSTDGKGNYDIEYNVGEGHYRCPNDSLPRRQVAEVFKRFNRRDPNWREGLAWEELSLAVWPSDSREPEARPAGHGCLGAIVVLAAIVSAGAAILRRLLSA